MTPSHRAFFMPVAHGSSLEHPMSTNDTPVSPPRILWGLDDIAAATGIPMSTLRNEMECTPLKGAFTIGRRVCALPADVQAWLEQLRAKNAYVPRKNSREAQP